MDRSGPRWGLAFASVLHALLYGLATFFVPWTLLGAFAIVCCILAVGFCLLSIAAFCSHQHLSKIWAIQSWAIFLFALWITFSVVSSAVYLSALYSGLGVGLSVALLLLLCPFYLLTLPMAFWGMKAATSADRKVMGVVAVAVLLPVLFGLFYAHSLAQYSEIPSTQLKDLVSKFNDLGESYDFRSTHSLSNPGPVRCSRSLDSSVNTVLAFFHSQVEKRTLGICIQGENEDLEKLLLSILEDHQVDGFLKIDVVTGVDHLEKLMSFLDGFQVNAGINGLCYNRSCLAPWQLVARDVFVSFTPLPFIPDLRLGISADLMAKIFKDSSLNSLSKASRIVTKSFLIDKSGLRRLSHLKSRDRKLNARNLNRAKEAAIDYIIAAQDGRRRFIYKSEPFTGKKDAFNFSLARHAGTTMALCEQASTHESIDRVIDKALKTIKQYARYSPKGVILERYKGYPVTLGQIALPLATLLTCDKYNSAYSRLMAGLTNTIMFMQRPDGSFNHLLDARKFRVIDSSARLYGDGQAVLALVLAKRFVQTANTDEFWPSLQSLDDALDKSMTYFSTKYWPSFLRDFFYLEENWHCPGR